MTAQPTSDELMNETDSQFISRINGLYVGQLTAAEHRWFIDCVRAGIAERSYENIMGVAKVKALI
jgi:hypothetical protein